MKKSSLFIAIVSFLLSIFLVSMLGGAIKDDQFKIYFSEVEILSYDIILEGEGGSKYKFKGVDFDESSGETKFAIDYRIAPEEATNSTAYEFAIVDGNEKFDIGDGQHTMKDCATIEKNILTFYHPVSIKVMLRTTDGSALSDFCTFICTVPETDSFD